MFFCKSRKVRRPATRRRLLGERLQERQLLAGDMGYETPYVPDCVEPPVDIDGNGDVEPLDALIVIRALSEEGGAFYYDVFAHAQEHPNEFLDASLDGLITPFDALLVINYLNRYGSGPFVIECPQEAGTLIVTQKETGTADTVVANQDNVTLLAFEATADDVEDIILTGSLFMASLGTMNDVAEFSLWVDTADSDNAVDTILDTSTDGIFDDLRGGGYVIPQDGTVAFEVRGEMSSSFTDEGEFQLAFANQTPVTAEALDDGSDLESVAVIVTDSTIFTPKDKGELFVTEDIPIPGRQVLGGKTSEVLLRAELSAKYEGADVYYVGIDVLGEGRSIQALEAYLPGATEPFALGTWARAYPGDDFGFRMESRQLVVGEDEVTDILFKARMKSDTQGGVSGDEFALAVDEVFARGDVSGNEIDTDVADSIVGPEHTVVMARHEDAVDANPDPDGSAVGTGEGSSAVFKFTADDHNNSKDGLNDIVHDQVVLLVESSNIEVDVEAFAWFNRANSTVLASQYRLERTDGTVITDPTVSGDFRIVFTDLRASAVDTEIDNGDAETFVFRHNITNRQVDSSLPSTLQVSFLADELVWYDTDASTEVKVVGTGLSETKIRSTRYES